MRNPRILAKSLSPSLAVLHHVDTDTLQPSTARVTFRFDAGDNLKSYELVTVAGSASQP